jgi:hypothetical protein
MHPQGYNNWLHIKIRGSGALAIQIRQFMNEYNTKLESEAIEA